MAEQQEQKVQQKQKPNFKDVQNGPLDQSNRQCRDIFCCLLFLGCIGAMIYVTIHAYLNGNPNKIYRGIANNVQCGKPNGTAQQYPYLYFRNPINSLDNRWCVKSCPVFQSGSLSTIQCFSGSCNINTFFAANGTTTASVASMNSSSHNLGYETTLTLDRVCLPTTDVLTNGLSSFAQTLTSKLQQGQFASLITDVKNNWQWLLCGLGIAVVISLIFFFLLRCLVGCIVWLSAIGIILVFVGAGVIFLYNGGAFKGTAAQQYAGFLGLPTLDGSDYYKTYGYICFGLAGLFFILLLCCCNRLRLAVAICKVAGRFVINVCHIVFLPIFLTIIQIGLWALCLLAMVYLLSAATFQISNSSDVFTSIKNYADRQLLQFYFFFFGTLWVMAFLSALGIFVVAFSTALWYYNHGANEELDSPISRGFKMAFRYHFGSLSFGALILAIVQFLQTIVEVFKRQSQAAVGDSAACFEYICNCVRCCLACVQRIVQFLNKTAYIQIALRGKNFCGAAYDGFSIVWDNGLRFLVVAGVGQIIMFLGKLMIASATTAIFYAIITFIPSIKANIIQPLYLMIIVFIISYSVGLLFMGIYSIAMDTILQAFIIDQMNQEYGGGKKALHAPQQLYDLLPQDD